MKLDGEQADFNSGTLELETQDMDVVQRVLEAMANRGAVMLDTTAYYPAHVDVRMGKSVVPDNSSSTFAHKYEFRPVATIKLRA